MNRFDALRYDLVKRFLNEAGLWTKDIKQYLDACKFQEQNDGGMGSFGIIADKERIGSRDYAEAEYVDADGQKVVIALIGDDQGFPTDVDFWKVDSTPLVRFPNAAELNVRVT